MLKLIVKLFLTVLVYVGLEQLIELKTHGFCLSRIQSNDLPHQERWETPPLTPEGKAQVEHLLQQPFYLIGAGSECFAFLSEDGKTVIKFFKLDKLRPVYLHRGLFLEDYSDYAGTLSPREYSPPFFKKNVSRLLGIREFRLQRTFSSIHLAYNELKEYTGLIYLHLNPGEEFQKPLTLYDSCGIAHEIDLNRAKFVLQQCATPLIPHFETILTQGKIKEAKTCIDTLLELLLTRCQKGIADRDIVSRNFGYIGNKAIEIDTGSFSKMATMKEKWLYRQELLYATLDLREWLKKHSPELAKYLEEQVDERISS